MLTYEQVRNFLREEAETAELEVLAATETVDWTTCHRTFSLRCATNFHRPNYRVYAEMSFSWSPILTAESVHPTASCLLYHADDEPCRHEEFEPDAVVHLEVRYAFGSPPPEEIPAVADYLWELVDEVVPTREVELRFPVAQARGGTLRCYESYIYYSLEFRPYEDELPFREVMREARALLEKMENSKILLRFADEEDY